MKWTGDAVKTFEQKKNLLGLAFPCPLWLPLLHSFREEKTNSIEAICLYYDVHYWSVWVSLVWPLYSTPLPSLDTFSHPSLDNSIMLCCKALRYRYTLFPSICFKWKRGESFSESSFPNNLNGFCKIVSSLTLALMLKRKEGRGENERELLNPIVLHVDAVWHFTFFLFFF